MAETEGYRVPEVCRTIGITYRQLDYWARTGLVTPSIREAGGSGTQRLYSFKDLVQLRVIKKLIDAGVTLQRVKSRYGELLDLPLRFNGPVQQFETIGPDHLAAEARAAWGSPMAAGTGG